MNLIDSFVEKARQNPARIVFPEGSGERIIVAAAKVKKMGIARPVILGNPQEVEKHAAALKVNIKDLEIIHIPDQGKKLEEYAQAYAATREVKLGIAQKLVKKPLAFGGMMVKNGDADGMVAGVATATAFVIQIASLTIGFQQGFTKPSSFFIMVIPEYLGEKNKPFIFADCAVAVAPNAQELAEIGVAAGMNAKVLLGIEPRIAFLSFSTKGSANHADVDKIREAVKLARELNPKLAIDGELQADAAIVPRVAAKKVKESDVAGMANVLVFPDLDAGNTNYKLVQYLANAKAFGPIMQGFAKPVNDMSRGATVDDLIGVTAITSVQAQNLNAG
ncbi:MAG: phosphate acetyltransferase [Calditrichaeota bacterium]|nr:MAG: phosphate acetyltransferase [Calditrichota bacterium]